MRPPRRPIVIRRHIMMGYPGDWFSPSLFFPPYNQFNLLSETLARWFLDLFDELNPMVTSTWCPDWWLWSWRWNIENSPARKIPPKKLHPPQTPSPPTVRTPWKVVSTPFDHAKSNDNLRLFARLMVAELGAKCWKLRQHEKFHHQTSPPQTLSPPTIRTPWKVISAPFDYAKSNDNLHLFARLMVAELYVKRWKLASNKNSAHQTSPPFCSSPLQSEKL